MITIRKPPARKCPQTHEEHAVKALHAACSARINEVIQQYAGCAYKEKMIFA
jgi:hypothetical protein